MTATFSHGTYSIVRGVYISLQASRCPITSLGPRLTQSPLYLWLPQIGGVGPEEEEEAVVYTVYLKRNARHIFSDCTLPAVGIGNTCTYSKYRQLQSLFLLQAP